MFREMPHRAPDVPRTITPDIEKDTRAAGAFLRLFGGIWSGVGLPLAFLATTVSVVAGVPAALLGAAIAGAIGLAGGVIHSIGRCQRVRVLRTYRDGVEAEGEVISVALDRRMRVNGRSPWLITYRFVANGREQEGVFPTWAADRPEVDAGARVLVLHDAEHPSRSVLWTRVSDVEPAPAATRLRVDVGGSSEADAEAQAEAVEEARSARRIP